jgi:hypothetical protein
MRAGRVGAAPLGVVVVGVIVGALALGSLPASAGAVGESRSASASRKVATSDPGEGTALALANPKCDRTTGRFRFQFYAAPPCVKAWPDGADNGGKTAQGVTATSVKVVVLYNDLPPSELALVGVYTNQATGKNETDAARASLLDEDAMFRHVYETWGRKVDYVFVRSTGADEAAQRADAIGVAQMKPFAVLDIASAIGTPGVGGGKVFEQTLVNEGVPYVSPRPTEQLTESTVYGLTTAEFVKKQLAGGKAEYAGEALRSRPRKYGVLHSSNFDIDYMNRQFRKMGLPVPVDAEFHVPPTQGDVRTDAAQVTDALPTLITRLKDAGVTTLLMETNHSVTGAATREMAKQDWFPEVVITSSPYQDLDLYARTFDQSVMQHAFGMVWFPPYTSGGGDPTVAPFQWFWGTTQGTRWTIAFLQMLGLYSVLQFTGPDLTARKVTPGVLAKIFTEKLATGGYYSDSATTVEVRVAAPGAINPRGVAMAWWDPDATAIGNFNLGGSAKGNYMYLDNAKRYLTGNLPTAKQKFFDPSVSIAAFDEPPPGEPVVPTYACEGCPSTGANDVTPASTHTG